MRLTGLTALVMVAFAANSVLNRVALAEGRIGAMDFALWRVASGAAALAVLVWWRDRRVVLAGPWRGTGVLALCEDLAQDLSGHVFAVASAGGGPVWKREGGLSKLDQSTINSIPTRSMHLGGFSNTPKRATRKPVPEPQRPRLGTGAFRFSR